MADNLEEESLFKCGVSGEKTTLGADPEISSITRIDRRRTVYKIDCKHCYHKVQSSNQAKKRLIAATALCTFFMVVEIVGGVLSNSLVIVTDAAHLLTDISAFSASLFAMWIARRSPTSNLNFGYHRAEVLAALFSILTIWLLTGILVYAAVRRIVIEEFDIDATIMLIVAGLGIAVNLVMGMVLHCNIGTEPNSNLNVKAAFIHVIGDLLQSCAVMIAAIIIYFVPDYKIADPICTLIFSVLVLCTTVKVLKDVIQILMEGVPRGINLQQIHELLMNLPNVVKVFNLRVWALTNERVALSAHIAIDHETNCLSVLKMATDTINENFEIFELTLQIEQYCSDSSECSACLREREEWGEQI